MTAAAAAFSSSIDAAGAVGFAEGGEVVELYLGAFDGEGLGFFRVGQPSKDTGSWRKSEAAVIMGFVRSFGACSSVG